MTVAASVLIVLAAFCTALWVVSKILLQTMANSAEVLTKCVDGLLNPHTGEAEVIHTEQEQMYDAPVGWQSWEADPN